MKYGLYQTKIKGARRLKAFRTENVDLEVVKQIADKYNSTDIEYYEVFKIIDDKVFHLTPVYSTKPKKQ